MMANLAALKDKVGMFLVLLLVVPGIAYYETSWALGFVLVGIIATVREVVWLPYRRKQDDVEVAILVGIVVIFGLLCALRIREMADGFERIIFVMIAAGATDTFANIVGAAIGKTPYSKYSTSKTKEGLYGGIIAGLALAWIGWFALREWGELSISALHVAIVSPMLVAAAVGGDHFGSVGKRKLGVKDYSNMFGRAHGGWIDRFGSYCFAFATFYAADFEFIFDVLF